METRNLTDLVRFSSDGPQHATAFVTERLSSEIVSLSQGQETGTMMDPDADTLLAVVAGEVVIYLNRKSKRLKQWGAVVARAGTEILIRNASTDPAVVLAVAAPPTPPAAPAADG